MSVAALCLAVCTHCRVAVLQDAMPDNDWTRCNKWTAPLLLASTNNGTLINFSKHESQHGMSRLHESRAVSQLVLVETYLLMSELNIPSNLVIFFYV